MKTKPERRKKRKTWKISTIWKEAQNDVVAGAVEETRSVSAVEHLTCIHANCFVSALCGCRQPFCLLQCKRTNEWKAKEKRSVICRANAIRRSHVRLLCSKSSARQQIVTVSFYRLKNSFRFYYRIYVIVSLAVAGTWQRVVRTWHTYLIHRHHHHRFRLHRLCWLLPAAIGFGMMCLQRMQNAQKRQSIVRRFHPTIHPTTLYSAILQAPSH